MRLRTEIQMLRAAAVLGVVGNHLAPGLVRGGYVGVDVFFVISGFLISSHLLKELDRDDKVSLPRFWARRARRLLPASLLVLAVSAAVSVLVVPMTMWHLIFRQIGASALYVQNWALALDAEDYFASSNSPSPVTHYWSLSVEEQFYLFWPVLAWGAWALGRRLGRPRGGLLAAFAVIVVASLGYSVWSTYDHPNSAYFETWGRMWQLGAGGLLAFVPALVRGRRSVAAAGWALVVGSELLFHEGLAVPGYLALLPVLGAAAVIWAKDAFVIAPVRAAVPFIAAAAWIGGISYSLYLWHWPLIVLTPYVTGVALTPATKLVVLAASVLLAWATARYVEDPVRQLPRLVEGSARRTLVPAGLAMVVVVTTAAAIPATVGDKLGAVLSAVNHAEASGARCFGARAIANDCPHPHRLTYADAPLITAENYRGPAMKWGHACQQTPQSPEIRTCEFGVPRDRATRRFVLVGDSHAQHWAAALDELANEYRWNIAIMAKSSCTVNSDPDFAPAWDDSNAESCHAWIRALVPRIAGDPSVDAVITSGITRRYVVPGAARPRQALIKGYQEVWRTWTEAGKKVVVIGDVPHMDVGDVPTCVARHPHEADPCTTPAKVALTPDPSLVAARAMRDPDVIPVELTRFFCSGGRCHSVIGGVVAYGDGNHMLPFFARALAPYLGEQMRGLTPRTN